MSASKEPPSSQAAKEPTQPMPHCEGTRCGRVETVFWLTWAVLLGAGLAGSAAKGTWLATCDTELKAASSVTLVLFAWLSSFLAPPPSRVIVRLVAAGMTLGCLGDASPLLGSLWPDPQRTLGNMVLFGIGHAAYIRACVLVSRRAENRLATGLWYASLLFWLVVGVIAWHFAANSGTRHLEMRFPALGYTLLLSATAGAATGCALQNRRFAPVAIGAVLFLISDLLLAVRIFHDFAPPPFDFVWLTYGPGQMLIVFGTVVCVDPRAFEQQQ